LSFLSIVASSSAFRLPASPPPKGSSIDSDWSTKNRKQPGFLRLISAWYAMVFLDFFWHHENCDSHMPEVTGWSPVATIPRMQQRPVGGRDARHQAGLTQLGHCEMAANDVSSCGNMLKNLRPRIAGPSLQTSALPLGYGAGRSVRSQLTSRSARVELQQRPAEHEQCDPKVDTEPGDIHQRGDERRRGRSRIEPEFP